MKLRAIRLHNVRRFAAKGIAIENIGDGVNVLAESNEYGKSTVFDAVHALFFQSHKGRPKPVQLLQPYSKGAVTVEADIETVEGVFRLRKRWYGSALAQVADAGGRIIAQADEADRWIDARMRGGGAGPAGLLWVQQGVVEMGQGTGKAITEEKAAREDVLTSVSGEIETLTGGRRTTQVLAKCQADLDILFTAKGGAIKDGQFTGIRKGGPLQKALDDLAALEDEIAETEARVRDLRGDLDSRAEARKRLSDLQDPETRARDATALAEAQAALSEAEDHASRLKTATSEENIARQERDLAQQALDRFDASAKAIADLFAKVAEGEAALATAKATLGNAQSKATESAAAREAARTASRNAAEILDRARAATLARAAAQQLATVQKTLAAAEDARQNAEAETAAAKARALPGAQIDALEKLDGKIATLTAEQRAASVSVSVAYADPNGAKIRHAGQPLTEGASLSLDGAARFEVEGVGTLTVTPGKGGADVSEALRAAAEKRTALLSQLGIDSLASARQRQSQAQAHERSAAEHASRLAALAPNGIDALKLEAARLQAEAGDATEPTDPIDTLTARLDDACATERTAEDAHDTAQAALSESENAAARIDTRLTADREALSREQAGGDPVIPRETLAETLTAKTAAFETAHRAATALRDNAPDTATLQARHQRAASIVRRAEEESATLRNTISTLNGSIGARAEEGIEEALSEATDRRALAADRVAALRTEAATLIRLRDVLLAAKAEAKDHFFEPVVKELKPLLGLVFGDAAVTFDEATLLPVKLERGGAEENFDVLSGGMREQITILTRLAFARLLAQDGRTVPVILDDALIYSDDARIERMFDALHRQALDLQILVFTCRQRAFQRLGGNALDVRDWVPEG